MRALFPVSCRTAADAYAGHGLQSVHEAPKPIDWAVESGRAASARSSLIGSAEVAPRYRRNKPELQPIFAAIAFAYRYLTPLRLQRHSCRTLVSVRPRHLLAGPIRSPGASCAASKAREELSCLKYCNESPKTRVCVSVVGIPSQRRCMDVSRGSYVGYGRGFHGCHDACNKYKAGFASRCLR